MLEINDLLNNLNLSRTMLKIVKIVLLARWKAAWRTRGEKKQTLVRF